MKRGRPLISKRTSRLVHADQSAGKPYAGRVVVYDPNRDPHRQYLADGLTPVKAAGYLKAADAGDLSALVELSEEIEDRDSHLQSVAGTRRDALTLLEWHIESAAEVEDDVPDQALADAAAQYCRETLKRMEEFPEALEHLASAIGPNLAVCELVWNERTELIDVTPVPSNRLVADYQRGAGVRILTEDEPSIGIAAEAQKFTVHVPKAKGGSAMRCFPPRGALIRPALLLHLVKHLAVKDWAIFCEVFGMPVRVAKYKQGASAEEKTEALDMLRLLGADAVGIFSEAMQLELVETPNRGVAPYDAIIAWAERQQSILYLGQTLTTDTSGGTGTYAAAKVHDNVRADLLQSDIQKEGRTIRRQILAPMTRWRFGPTAPTPYFKREIDEPPDRKLEAEVAQIATQGIGLPLKREQVYERIGYDVPGENDETIERIAQPAGAGMPGLGGFGGGFGGGL